MKEKEEDKLTLTHCLLIPLLILAFKGSKERQQFENSACCCSSFGLINVDLSSRRRSVLKSCFFFFRPCNYQLSGNCHGAPFLGVCTFK
jgi:hypothetical protein